MEAPVWQAAAGRIVGWRDGDVHRATGIRYARAARYHEPVPEPEGAEVVATQWSPVCPQGPAPGIEDALGLEAGGTGLEVDEDCLRVSVTAPADASPDERLPVIVFVHGGSYVLGAADAPMHDPAPLVREHRVVGVTVGYRLGLLGFLGRPGVSPPNLGVLDQLEAFRWVRRNIAAFGGDPDNVTAMGQSAGADSVANLMVADGGRGLFRRAIIQSAPLGLMRRRMRMTTAMRKVATTLLPDATVEATLEIQQRVVSRCARFGLKGGMPFGPEYGAPPLPPEEDLDAAYAAVAPEVDLLIGYTTREAALFFPPRVGATVGRRVTDRLVTALTKRIYGTAALRFAARHRAAGGKGGRYLLVWEIPGNPLSGAHIADLPLLLGSESAWRGAALIKGPTWQEVAERGRELRAIWAHFARTGEVVPGDIPGLVKVREL